MRTINQHSESTPQVRLTSYPIRRTSPRSGDARIQRSWKHDVPTRHDDASPLHPFVSRPGRRDGCRVHLLERELDDAA
jgi:hypothetical protein